MSTKEELEFKEKWDGVPADEILEALWEATQELEKIRQILEKEAE